jgi:hypothetical protein
MFYETEKSNHGLAHNPFKSLIIQRPIGWISSQDNNVNINLAPYSPRPTRTRRHACRTQQTQQRHPTNFR